jgi:hypothetical protein
VHHINNLLQQIPQVVVQIVFRICSCTFLCKPDRLRFDSRRSPSRSFPSESMIGSRHSTPLRHTTTWRNHFTSKTRDTHERHVVLPPGQHTGFQRRVLYCALISDQRRSLLDGDDNTRLTNPVIAFIVCDAISTSTSKRQTHSPSGSPPMASATLSANPQPLATVSHSRQNHLNRPRSFSSASGAFDDLDSPGTRPNPQMSFSMSQGSLGCNLMMQAGGPFRQYEGNNALNRRNSAPQIYSVSPFLNPS